MATKPAYPPLQRHRRKSSQPSPTSPSFPRRLLDRPSRIIDPFSPVDSLSATSINSNSPSLDVSPALDHRPSPSYDAAQVQNVKRMPVRISDEHTRPRPQALQNVPRPFTSDAMDGKSSLYNISPHGYSYDQGLKGSPNMAHYNERLSSEDTGRSAEGHSPYLHSFGPSSYTLDKAFQDDQGPTKLNAGKKSRLNLLNPMSLLARRRSSQNQNDATNLSVHTMHVPALPDNFDPSIRGTITHDFSAPRTRRNHSYGGDGSLPDSGRRDFLSPGYQSTERTTPKLQPPSGPTPTHSPMFKEHFQDDRQNLRPAETGYLHNMAMQSTDAEGWGASVPAFARKLPTRIPQQTPEAPSLDRPLPEEPKASPPPIPTEPPPPPPPKRTPSPVINLPPASVLPKHMTSTSSRFSFQLAGQASSAAQEKLLEEKHKQAQGTKRVSKLSRAEDVDDDNFDDYDFDADDGFEEAIPLANADYEEDDGFGRDIDTPAHGMTSIETLTSSQPQPLQGFHFTPQSLTFSPTSTHHHSEPTPRDDQGFAIGIAGSRDSPELAIRPSSAADVPNLAFYNGLGIMTSTAKDASLNQLPQKKTNAFDDEDLYFDDGEFGDDDLEAEANAFDEDALDDESKIRDIPAENLRKYEAAIQAAGPDGVVKVASPQRSSSKTSDRVPVQSFTGELTETNLAAYHDALANAANEAALNGKFRNISFSHAGSDDDTSHSQSQLGIISDESRYSYNNLPPSSIAEDDGFPFDDDMDDDLMIAEANAEALENDDDGFYGQEFGFYARARAKDGNEMVNGGFFAPRGSNGVKRSHSGRGNFQEPSLTPITERSEWSTRNSVASLQIPPGIIPGSANSLPSPGIAQLLELDSPGYGDDPDMSFSALMKLRRGAFGGSSTSVSSLSGSHAPAAAGGSPLGHTPYSPQDLGYPHTHQHLARLHSKTVGIPESEEEDDYDEGTNDHTLTQNTPSKKAISPVDNTAGQLRVHTPTLKTPQDMSVQSPSLASPISLNTLNDGRASMDGHPSSVRKAGGHHSRTSSGAESVSYARDTDGRWVLERRRTGEDGGMEIEREWAGGRI